MMVTPNDGAVPPYGGEDWWREQARKNEASLGEGGRTNLAALHKASGRRKAVDERQRRVSENRFGIVWIVVLTLLILAAIVVEALENSQAGSVTGWVLLGTCAWSIVRRSHPAYKKDGSA